ncbi:ATP-binding protein [uncultured Fibrella sp.]|uniref:ATP-binding protein n=1 Tax=uncultured Fibrella sp. TaxID=1284596 RepID=UPI0035C9AA85
MHFTEATLVFLGMTGMMTLYVGGQAIVTGERAYRWYTIYSLCWSCYFIVKVFDPFESTPYDTVAYGCCRVVIPMISYLCYYSFADALLNFQENLPRVYRLFRQTQAVLLLYVLTEIITCLLWPGWVEIPAHEWIHSAVRVGVAVVSVWGIVHASHRRDTLVNYFLVGSSLLLVGALTSMLLSLSMSPEQVPLWEEPLFYLQVGIASELLCFSLGLSYKNKLVEVEKATTEQALLLEREQRKVAQLRTHFFTNISHEFRTPLTLLIGPLTQLIQSSPGDVTFRMMHRQASRLLTLVNQLLDLTKLDAGQLLPRLQAGDLPRFLRGLAGSFASLADSRDIRLLVDADEQPTTSFYDADKLEKIVDNLIGNALKFTPAGGVVQVRYRYDTGQKQATIQVADTGPGIPPEQQVRIFERFYQSPQTMQSGTGIGLALVQELVSVLHGQVTLSSQPGEGATFTVTLPISLEAGTSTIPFQQTELPVTASLRPDLVDEGPARLTNPDEVQPDAGELPLLLLIDDNDDVRQYLRMLFTTNYRLLEAENGRQGLAKASQLLPDLVVCDLMMPDMDGLAFCEGLRQQVATDHIPVILLTAKADIDSRIDGLRRGADDYVAKPFHPLDLQTRVQNLLQQRRRLRDRFSREFRLQPTNVVVSSAEERFLQQAISVVENHLADSTFDVEALSGALNLSRMQLHRKLKALTNQSATEFVRQLRLQRAADLLRQRSATVSEVAFGVGFESLSYFTKAFRDQYGTVPSEFK